MLILHEAAGFGENGRQDMKRMIAAFALASALGASAAWAQSDMSMDEALSMLEIAAQRELTAIGVTDVDPMALSLSQLAQIRSIMGSSEYNENEKAGQIRRIVGAN
jgi:hypothetical protein